MILPETEGGFMWKYMSCPALFVPPSVRTFKALRDTHDRFHFPYPPLRRISCRYLLALMYFENKLVEYTKEKS